MPKVLDYVAYLSQEVGPRPAGTEEEQQAALYIAEQMQKESGLSTVIEDFNSLPDTELPEIVCCAISLVMAVAVMLTPAAGVISILLMLAAAILYAAESFGIPVISRLMAQGVSQNVVVKYEPGPALGKMPSSRRKIVLVARYDSGKVRAELNGPWARFLHMQQWASLGALVVLPLLTIVRVVSAASGALLVVLNVLTIIAMVLAAIPLVLGVLHKIAPYNEGANCNASATAVLLEVARRVGRGRVRSTDAEPQPNVVIHGEGAARSAGLIPEDTQVVYKTSRTSAKSDSSSSQTPEARLASAKAAIAALTGKSVEGAADIDFAQIAQQEDLAEKSNSAEAARTTQIDSGREPFKPESQTIDTGAKGSESQEPVLFEQVAAVPSVAGQVAPVKVVESTSVHTSAVPDWFTKAQKKAKRPQVEKPAQRSRYASALDAAQEESAGAFSEAITPVAQNADIYKETYFEIKPEPEIEQGLLQAEELDTKEAPVEPLMAQEVSFANDAEDIPDHVENVSNAEAIEDVVETTEIAPCDASVVETSAEVELVDETSTTGVLDPIVEASTQSDEDAMPEEVPQSKSVNPSPSVETIQNPFGSSPVLMDLSSLHLEDVPDVVEPSMPSFLEPRLDTQHLSTPVSVDSAESIDTDTEEASEMKLSDSIVSEEMQVSADGVDEAEVDAAASSYAEEVPVSRPAIKLPDIGVEPANSLPAVESLKQRAPLADVESSGKAAAKSLLNMLPSISLGKADAAEDISEETPSPVALLRSTLPSLSGSISRVATTENSSVNVAGSFVAAGATGSFAPVGDELIEDIQPEDIYVEDADDSVYEEGFTETGAFAGPDYVEMPKSRVRRFFDRFRRKNVPQEETTAREWLDVDEDFDARTVGAERGGWESFREDSDYEDLEATTSFDSFEVADAYVDNKDDFIVDDLASAENQLEPDEFEPLGGEGFEEDEQSAVYDTRTWNGGAFSVRRVEEAQLDSQALAEESAKAVSPAAVDEEIRQIYQFRNPDIDVEVWFVSLGSELARNSGMRDFLAKHHQDMRGAIIVDLEALGAGELCMVEREGRFKPVKTSSRMKRYVRKAAQVTGLHTGTASIPWSDSSASFAIKHGCQAMRLVGMENSKPAHLGQVDDMLENIDEATLAENTDFIVELLKNM